MEGVNATEWNNIIVTGDCGEILKWNGEQWKMIPDFLDFANGEAFNRSLVLGGELFVIGADRQNAMLVHGK